MESASSPSTSSARELRWEGAKRSFSIEASPLGLVCSGVRRDEGAGDGERGRFAGMGALLEGLGTLVEAAFLGSVEVAVRGTLREEAGG